MNESFHVGKANVEQSPASLLRCPCYVRREISMRLLEQRVVGKWRFLVHHVGSVASKLATGKSFCHGSLVNKGATV